MSQSAGALAVAEPTVGSPRPTAVRLSWFERSWWTAGGLTLLLWSFRLVGSASSYPAVVPLVVVTSAWGVATIITAWSASDTPPQRRLAVALPWITVAVGVAAFGTWCLLQVLQAPSYGTDEIAFDQYAAQLMAHGVDPYARSMAPALSLFHVQPGGYTFRLDGTAVTTLSYPSPSFLVYVPLLLVGVSTQTAIGVNIVAWMVATVALFALLPRAMRPMALVIGGLSVYVGYAVGGVTAALFVPLLVGAALDWHRFGEQQGWRAWRGPVLLGLAMGINQAPWLVLPFAVIGVGMHEAQRAGRRAGVRCAGRYLAFVAVTFAAPNLPFIFWHPADWAQGILTPLTQATVPAGQGLIALPLYLHLGGGSLTAYTLLSLVAVAAIVVIYAVTWPRLRPAAWLLPAVALLLATRSYGSYMMGLVPAALLAAVTARGDHPVRSLGERRRRAVSGSLAAVTLIGLLAALWPSPLSVTVTSIRTTGQLATVDQVTVAVRNRTAKSVVPHFTLSNGDAVTSFWIAEGPARLAAHSSASYTLLAPNFPAQPSINGGFQVVAFTTTPAGISHSGTYSPTTDHVVLEPEAVNRVVPIGEAITLHAELLDRLNRPVHQSGVPIYLGQIIYGQAGLQYGEAIINSSQTGQTPVSALTNAAGVASFIIQGTRATPDPVSFEANLVSSQHFYPYGYSEIVPVRFGP